MTSDQQKSYVSTNTDLDFWDQSWSKNHIGFHMKDRNP